jgi:hypothetical protein
MAARQGNTRGTKLERGPDLYETPPEATLALLREVGGKLPRRIWEPAAGRGAISRELLSAGFDVVATDLHDHPGRDPEIETGLDFLTQSHAQGCDVVITNPPFSQADRFIRHCVTILRVPCIVLLRLLALEGAGRGDVIDNHLAQVLVGIERLPVMHRDGWAGNRLTDSLMAYGWFVFTPAFTRGQWTGRRISWRG